MTHLSLTSRLSLMFTLLVLSVLLLTGAVFKQLSLMHFRTLDQQELESKLHSAAKLLQNVHSRQQFELRAAEFDALFGHHERLLVTIVGPGGDIWLRRSQGGDFPTPLADGGARLLEWQEGDHLYRGMSREITLGGDVGNVKVALWLDDSLHQRYLNTAERWFWTAFGLCALGSWGLGWLVARNGLRPVRSVTGVVSSISSRSLKERIPLDDIPAELQGLAQTFNSMLARLEDDFIRLSNFSSDIAHELRTPISSLITHTEVVLARPRSADDYREALYSNLEELQRMAKMVEDMLFIAKSDNALIVPGQAFIDLRELVSQLFDYYELLADDEGIRLACEGRGSITGDPSMLRRALSNLLSNAIRHSNRDATVSVRIVERADAVELCVANTGALIPADDIERIFDRFYRLDPARREGHSSHAGLGLAITRAIVESHGGSLGCESDRQSTRFIIRLPRTPG